MGIPKQKIGKSICLNTPANGATGNGARESVQKDEPEVAVLFVACGIGLVTGAGVVLFNYAIETIRQAAFLQAPVESVAWGIWARQLSLKSSLLVTLLPPTVGGLSVGLLRYLSGEQHDANCHSHA